MAGSAGDPFFAAWKTLVVKGAWSEPSLETVLCQVKFNDAPMVMRLAADVFACGILFSQKLREKNPSVQDRREAFRRLVSNSPSVNVEPNKKFGEFFADELKQRLKVIVDTAVADEILNVVRLDNDYEKEIDGIIIDVVEEMQKFVNDKWHLIEPAQIITYKATERGKYTSLDSDSILLVQKLLEHTDIDLQPKGE